MRAQCLVAFGLLAPAAAQQPTSAASRAADPIEACLERARPRADEERWRLIPWLTSLTRALTTAREAGKPVFLFGYDGVLDTGNC